MGSRDYHSQDVLEELYYDEGLTQKEIADKFGVAHQTISRWMNRHGINPGIEKGQFDETNGVNFFTTKEGYEIIAAWNKEAKKMEHVKHHRLLACLSNDLCDVSGKHVHHKNDVKWDNRPANLEIMEPTEHLQRHAQTRENDHLLTAGETREMVKSWERNEKGQFAPSE
jgi:DNA-binding XRE family transcriptional regulator